MRFAKLGSPLVVGPEGTAVPQAFDVVQWDGQNVEQVADVIGDRYGLRLHVQLHDGQPTPKGEETDVLEIEHPGGAVQYAPLGYWVSVKVGGDRQLETLSDERLHREYVHLKEG